ncbi:MAG: 3-phosphoshikimate 1-carboxyvinyltransferase [Candidatus Eremiobacteraeota bacterium]|nr:3-phosphoshikimate 1-carboxyvinyltransferase [Candidatus Eremiobacteraeota bacterium]MBV9263950.1 3-phosphoshikimate 1-carboxyvinyltransferase [Candidatus Eremiobacteraeota bacterium]
MAGERVTFDAGPVRGELEVPGDKSISHRALIAGAASLTSSRISGLNAGRDVRATRDALGALGAVIGTEAHVVTVEPAALRSPGTVLDCMNSGSTARMLLGVCAGASVWARFDGDGSLRRRPMEPVAAQLRAFGARIETTLGRLPLEIRGTPEVQTRHFILLAPSAQVKSALLFAALFARVAVQVDGDRGSRDHTERMIGHLGGEIEWDGATVRLGTRPLHGGLVEVPGDFSSAAFFITGAAVTPGSSVLVRNVGVNPARIGLIEALREMGSAIELRRPRMRSGEPVADIAAEYRPLHGCRIDAGMARRAIDEIPLLAVAAAFAAGTTTVDGVGDLRTKESDRLAAIGRLCASVGIGCTNEGRRLVVSGGSPKSRGGEVAADGDHRIAMAAAVLAGAAGALSVDSADSIEVSFPGFLEAWRRRGG